MELHIQQASLFKPFKLSFEVVYCLEATRLNFFEPTNQGVGLGCSSSVKLPDYLLQDFGIAAKVSCYKMLEELFVTIMLIFKQTHC